MPRWKSLHRVAAALHLADDTWWPVPDDAVRTGLADTEQLAVLPVHDDKGPVHDDVGPDPVHDDVGPDDDLTGPAPRRDVAHALLLMMGPGAAGRIDGLGLAREALDHPPTGDPRRDLSDDERGLVTAARAWCLAVHSDLAIGTIEDDPILLAEAERHALQAYHLRGQDPQVVATLALVRHRQGRHGEAVAWAEWAVAGLARHPDLQIDGRLGATLATALMVLALARWRLGDELTAAELLQSADAWRDRLEVDDVAFVALAAEAHHIPSTLLVGTAQVDGFVSGLDADGQTGTPTGTAGEPIDPDPSPWVTSIHSERSPADIPA